MTFVNTLLNSASNGLASGDFLHDGAFFAGLNPFAYSAGFFLHFVYDSVYINIAGAFFFYIFAFVCGVLFFNALLLVNGFASSARTTLAVVAMKKLANNARRVRFQNMLYSLVAVTSIGATRNIR